MFTCLICFCVERFDVTNLPVEGDAIKNMLCLRKITISSVAVACRRVGSQRVKSVPACKKQYYKKKSLFRTEVLLRQRTCVLNSYMFCCFCNGSGRPYDDIEYVEPCDLYNNGIYEYQQVLKFMTEMGIKKNC